MTHFGLRHNGFTLLEVLIAIAITFMIGLGSAQILNSAIRASEATQERLQQFGELQKAMMILGRDLQQIAARSIRDEFGDYQSALKSQDEFYKLEFSRVGWRNPLADQRSDLQRVAYELDEDKLIRHYWQVMDRAQDSKPLSQTLLTEVEEISFRFMNSSGGWLDKWPSDDNKVVPDRLFKMNQLPKAISLVLKHKQYGELTRLFDLPVYLANQNFPTPSGGGGGEGEEEQGSGKGGGNATENGAGQPPQTEPGDNNVTPPADEEVETDG